MKRFLIILFSISSLSLYAQSYTQKRNDLFNRTEYYDSNGRMIGYSKTNDLFDREEFYNSHGNLQYTENWNDIYDRTEVRDRYGNIKAIAHTMKFLIEKKPRIRMAISVLIRSGMIFMTDMINMIHTETK